MENLDLYNSSTVDYLVVMFIFIVIGAAAKLLDNYLQLRTDREFNALIDDILNQVEQPDTKESIEEQMSIVIEAIHLAYDMDEDYKAIKLGEYLNQLRELQYKV